MQYFTTKTREDGTTYYVLIDGHPQWLIDAVREAHDDELPNDWRFETCAKIWEALLSAAQIPDPDDYDDAYPLIESIARDLVSPFTAEVLKWLADYPTRTSYVDEALEEYRADSDIDDLLWTAQWYAVQQMVTVLMRAHRANVLDLSV
jgi:hypothetical protein